MCPGIRPGTPDRLRRVRQLKPRLLVVLGTPALMVVAPLEKNTPVVFALVADPYFTGVAYGPEHPEDHQENITGLASPPPLEAALQQGAGLLGKGPWGLLYDPADGVAAALAQEFTRKAPQLGIIPLTETSSEAASDRQGLERLLGPGGEGALSAAGGQRRPLRPAAAGLGPTAQGHGGERLSRRFAPGGAAVGGPGLSPLGEEAAALARRVLQRRGPQKDSHCPGDPFKGRSG